MTHFRSTVAISTALFLLVLTALSTAQPVLAGGQVTNCNDDSEFSTRLSGGGTVTFDCGTKTIALSSIKNISANTTINGDGKITLSGSGSRRLFVVNSGFSLTLQNITLTAGYGFDGNGGTIVNVGNLTLTNVTIQNASTSNYYGGAVYTTGPVVITGSTLIDNKAGNGGAIYAAGGTAKVNITNSLLQGNSVASNLANHSQGGAIMLYDGAELTISASTLVGNSAKIGGAIYIDTGKATLTNTTVEQNESKQGGGGIFNKGTLIIQASTIVNNQTEYIYSGGGIYNQGLATLTGVTISNNRAGHGAGVTNEQGTLTFTGGTVSDNSANISGGGGIASSMGTLTLTNLTISGNFGAAGGGVENHKGIATLTNITLSDNYASSGGGMWNLHGGTAYLTNITFMNNSATNGGGLGNTDYPDVYLYLKNVLFAKSKQGDNCMFEKPPVSSDFNLSSDGTCAFGGSSDNVKLKLGKLETNGGAVLTHRLKSGNPAIDGGTCTSAPPDDARGVARFKGTTCDVGAFEYVPCAGAPTAPLVLAPAHKAKLQGKVTLDWSGPDCATRFSVIVRQGSKSGNIVFDRPKINNTQVTPTSLPTGFKFFWQVTACNDTGCTPGPWSKFKLKP